MMEGSGISLREWINERFRSYDSRIRSNHDNLAKQAGEINQQGRDLVGMRGEVKDQGEDIKEMKEDMKWIKRGLFGAIAVGMMFTVAVASLVIQAAGG